MSDSSSKDHTADTVAIIGLVCAAVAGALFWVASQ